jgi:hypothetical protein
MAWPIPLVPPKKSPTGRVFGLYSAFDAVAVAIADLEGRNDAMSTFGDFWEVDQGGGNQVEEIGNVRLYIRTPLNRSSDVQVRCRAGATRTWPIT